MEGLKTQGKNPEGGKDFLSRIYPERIKNLFFILCLIERSNILEGLKGRGFKQPFVVNPRSGSPSKGSPYLILKTNPAAGGRCSI